MLKPEDLHGIPNALARHYTRFRVSERLLLTGHSHQAWPDFAFEAQSRAWLDAAEHVDEKWERAFAMAERVRQGYARLLGNEHTASDASAKDGESSAIALSASTHDLVIRFLSALPLRERPRIVTTDGEYHTIRRQVDRLAEEGIEIVKVPALPAESAAERLAAAVDDRTAAVLASAVLYRTAHIIPGLGGVAKACHSAGAELLVDAYHALAVVPFALKDEGLEDAFVVGGGYKYCQLGEGNAFMRIPPGCRLRPVITGWFSEFDTMTAPKKPGQVDYGDGPARFAGSTYEPASHYRAAAVFDFFEELGLTPAFLRAVNQHQVGLLARLFDGLDADPAVIARDRSVSLESLGGFLALQAPQADALCAVLRRRGVRTDARGDIVRLGPAPYLSDQQLEDAVQILGEVVQSFPKT